MELVLMVEVLMVEVLMLVVVKALIVLCLMEDPYQLDKNLTTCKME